MISLGIKNRVDEVVFQPLMVYSPAVSKIALNDQEMQSLYDSQLNVVRQLIHNSGGVTTNFWSLGKNGDAHPVSNSPQGLASRDESGCLSDGKYGRLLKNRCYEPFYRLHINSQGKVSPCCMITHSEKDNINEHSLRDIWGCDSFLKIRQEMSGNKIMPECAHCALTLSTHNQAIRRRLIDCIKRQQNPDNQPC